MPSDYRYELPANAIGTAPPRIEVTERRELRPDGTRSLRLRLHARGWVTSMTLPRAALASWSLGELPGPAVPGDVIHAMFVAPATEGESFELTLRGAGPVRVTLAQVQAPGHTPELDEVARRLPSWTTARMQILQQVEVEL
jgi:hypothetical protein